MGGYPPPPQGGQPGGYVYPPQPQAMMGPGVYDYPAPVGVQFAPPPGAYPVPAYPQQPGEEYLLGSMLSAHLPSILD